MSNVSIIFTPEPDQWGLRGDPFLWQLLKERYQAVELPYTPMFSDRKSSTSLRI